MLVLSRRESEEVIVAGNVRIRIVSVQGSRVRVGIEAPADVEIRRAEIPPLSAAGRETSNGPAPLAKHLAAKSSSNGRNKTDSKPMPEVRPSNRRPRAGNTVNAF